MCRYVHVSSDSHRDQERLSDLVEVELWAAVSHLCGDQETNSRPLQEQYAGLTTQSFLHVYA